MAAECATIVPASMTLYIEVSLPVVRYIMYVLPGKSWEGDKKGEEVAIGTQQHSTVSQATPLAPPTSVVTWIFRRCYCTMRSHQ